MSLLIQYTILYASVLILVALGGCFSEHSGVINLGLIFCLTGGRFWGRIARGIEKITVKQSLISVFFLFPRRFS